MNKITTPAPRISGIILSNQGDTTFNGNLDEAMDFITNAVQKFGQWLIVKDKHISFTLDDAASLEAARQTISNEGEFMLTYQVTGGGWAKLKAKPVAVKPKAKVVVKTTPKTVYRGTVTSKPISQILTGKRKAQLIVSARTDHGVEYVEVFVTSFNGGKARLEEHREQILATVFQALRPTEELEAQIDDNVEEED